MLADWALHGFLARLQAYAFFNKAILSSTNHLGRVLLMGDCTLRHIQKECSLGLMFHILLQLVGIDFPTYGGTHLKKPGKKY